MAPLGHADAQVLIVICILGVAFLEERRRERLDNQGKAVLQQQASRSDMLLTLAPCMNP